MKSTASEPGVTDHLSLTEKKSPFSYDLQKGKTNSTKNHQKPLSTILFVGKTKSFESIQSSFNIPHSNLWKKLNPGARMSSWF